MTKYREYETDAGVAADLAAQDHILNSEILNENTLLVHPEVRTLNLEEYALGRNRKRGTFKTTDINSFATYIADDSLPKDVRIFIDPTDMQATAILNFGEEGFSQGRLDHKAVLNAKPTATFAKLMHIHTAGRCNQKTFAEFLEDWGHVVVAKDSEHNVIDNNKAINAVRSMQINENKQTESHTSNYRESRSQFEHVEAESIGNALPAYFSVLDECYDGLTPVAFGLRLGIGHDDGKPMFKLEIIGLQLLRDSLAKSFADDVVEAIDETSSVLIGSFSG